MSGVGPVMAEQPQQEPRRNLPRAAAMSTLRFVTTWGYNPECRNLKVRKGKRFRHLTAWCKSQADLPASVTVITGAAQGRSLMHMSPEKRRARDYLRRVLAMVWSCMLLVPS